MSHKTSMVDQHRMLWRSVPLRPWSVAWLSVAEAAIITAIITLLVLSTHRSGFITVGLEATTSDFSFEGALGWGQGLLWTTFPTVLMVLYQISRDSVLAALIVEAPFIELQKTLSGKPVNARKSVYLDYRTSFPYVAWWKAFQNGHMFLGLCMLLSFVGSIGLVPLTARLFAPRVVQLPHDAPINLLSSFDETVDLANANYGALLDGVLAYWMYKSPLPVGTDGLFAFPRVSPAQRYENYTIDFPANATRLTLDCTPIRADDLFTTGTEDPYGNASISFYADDRGCSTVGGFSTSESDKENLEAVLTDDCSEDAGRARISFYYGSYSSANATRYNIGNLTNVVIVSCIPRFETYSGTLSVAATTFLGNRTIESPTFRPGDHSLLDIGFTQSQFQRPAGSTNVRFRLADLIVRHIDATAGGYTAEAITAAAQLILPAFYIMLAMTYLYPPLAQPLQQPGIIRIPTNRLHVVPPVAIAMLAILFIFLLSTLYLVYYLRTHPSILSEEPVGIFGAANLLHGSDISSIISSFHTRADFDGRLSRVTKVKLENQRFDDVLKRADCWVEPGTRAHNFVIRMRLGSEKVLKINNSSIEKELNSLPLPEEVKLTTKRSQTSLL